MNMKKTTVLLLCLFLLTQVMAIGVWATPSANEASDAVSADEILDWELSEDEQKLIKRYGSAWGCDICAAVCPYTKKAVAEGNTTPIGFFKNDRIIRLTSETVENMDKQTFRQRAFAWRGKKTVLRNLEIIGK